MSETYSENKMSSPAKELFNTFFLNHPTKEVVKSSKISTLSQENIKIFKCRCQHELLMVFLIGSTVFALQIGSVFTTTFPVIKFILLPVTFILGFFIHYILPQLTNPLPWLFFCKPFLSTKNFNNELPWHVKLHIWALTLEKYLLYPLIFLHAINSNVQGYVDKYGIGASSLLLTFSAFRNLNSIFHNSSKHYITLLITYLFFNFDYAGFSEGLLLDFTLVTFAITLGSAFLLKLQFVIIYIAPWQITWGSVFHVIAQPLGLPHSAILFFQAFLGAILSLPLSPLLGSTIFISSYMRPTKFWEKKYKTDFITSADLKLHSHLEEASVLNDNKLDAIFYHHLSLSLKRRLCGDLMLGKFGVYESGDFFILTNDTYTALLHIIAVGNGYVHFQFRGLEFNGTFCQQTELEAINENYESHRKCLCCNLPNALSFLLSTRASFKLHCLAWNFVSYNYLLPGYSVNKNFATSLFNSWDLKSIFVTYFVKSTIYFLVSSVKLLSWLNDSDLKTKLPSLSSNDSDICFTSVIDRDYDIRIKAISRKSFLKTFSPWIKCCFDRMSHGDEEFVKKVNIEDVYSLSYFISLAARRALFSYTTCSAVNLSFWLALNRPEYFLSKIDSLFKGDFRFHDEKDNWLFHDIDFTNTVLAPAIKLSLKLHLDYFTFCEESDETLHDAILQYTQEMVIAHENDPLWSEAILLREPTSLLAFRRVVEDGTYNYKVIMLNKRALNFRVLKINKEAVRGLWAGQQQELIYFRNKNCERGSIQNAKQVLRNMVNSSCDQPLGYPAYVSPLLTSFKESHDEVIKVLGEGSLSITHIKGYFSRFFRSLYSLVFENRNITSFSLLQCLSNLANANLEQVSMSKHETKYSTGAMEMKQLKGHADAASSRNLH